MIISYKNFEGQEINLTSICDVFVGCDFRKCKLKYYRISSNAPYGKVKFINCSFDDLDLSDRTPGYIGVEAEFVGCKMNGTNFTGQIIQSYFYNCQLQEANFSGTALYGSTFEQCDCTGCRFDEAEFKCHEPFVFAEYATPVKFINTILDGCNFTDQQKEDANNGI